jgi:hypothetical protein
LKIGISLEVDAKDKNLLKKELDTLKKELEKKMKITMSTENKKTLDTEKLIAQAKERTAQVSQKQVDIDRKQASDMTKKAILEKESLKRQQQQLEIMKQQAQIKIENITSGKYSKYADTDAISNIQSKMSEITIDDDGLNKMKLLNQELTNVAHTSKIASLGANTFFDDMKYNAGKFLNYMAIGSVFMTIVNGVQSGVQSIFELDKAIVELQKTTEATNEEISQFVSESYALADALATTNIEVIKSVAIFSKMGYELNEASQLGQLAVKLQTVGDGMGDIESTANSLVAVLKGFGVDENSAVAVSAKRVDQLNAVSNAFAVSTGDLTSGMQRTSATMAQANNTFEQSIALQTASTEILQSWELSSRGLIAISQRLRGVTEDGSLTALTLEDSFNRIGISISNADGSIKSTFDILTELHDIYPSLTETQRQWIGNLVAGRDQIKVLNSLMANFGTVQEAMTVQMNANGSATEELNRKLNSLEGRVNGLVNAFNKMWSTGLDSSIIKGTISLITELVEAFTTLNVATGGLLAPTLLLIGVMSKFGGLNLPKLLYDIAFNMGLLTTGTYGASGAFEIATISATSFNIALGAIGVILMAGAVIFNKYQEAVKNTKEETEKFKQAQLDLEATLSKVDSMATQTAIELESL